MRKKIPRRFMAFALSVLLVINLPAEILAQGWESAGEYMEVSADVSAEELMAASAEESAEEPATVSAEVSENEPTEESGEGLPEGSEGVPVEKPADESTEESGEGLPEESEGVPVEKPADELPQGSADEAQGESGDIPCETQLPEVRETFEALPTLLATPSWLYGSCSVQEDGSILISDGQSATIKQTPPSGTSIIVESGGKLTIDTGINAGNASIKNSGEVYILSGARAALSSNTGIVTNSGTLSLTGSTYGGRFYNNSSANISSSDFAFNGTEWHNYGIVTSVRITGGHFINYVGGEVNSLTTSGSGVIVTLYGGSIGTLNVQDAYQIKIPNGGAAVNKCIVGELVIQKIVSNALQNNLNTLKSWFTPYYHALQVDVSDGRASIPGMDDRYPMISSLVVDEMQYVGSKAYDALQAGEQAEFNLKVHDKIKASNLFLGSDGKTSVTVRVSAKVLPLPVILTGGIVVVEYDGGYKINNGLVENATLSCAGGDTDNPLYQGGEDAPDIIINGYPYQSTSWRLTVAWKNGEPAVHDDLPLYMAGLSASCSDSNYEISPGGGLYLKVMPRKAVVSGELLLDINRSASVLELLGQTNVTVSNMVSGETLSQLGSGIVLLDDDGNDLLKSTPEPGESCTVASIRPAQTNYELWAENLTLRTMKVGTAQLSMEGWVYGEEAKKPQLTIKSGEYDQNTVTYTYSVDGSEQWTDEVPENAGDYLVRGILPASGEWGTLVETQKFTITPKAIDWSGVHWSYTEKKQGSVSESRPYTDDTLLKNGDITYTVLLSGLPEDAAKQLQYTGDSVKKNIGSYTVTAAGKPGNYDFSDMPEKLKTLNWRIVNSKSYVLRWKAVNCTVEIKDLNGRSLVQGAEVPLGTEYEIKVKPDEGYEVTYADVTRSDSPGTYLWSYSKLENKGDYYTLSTGSTLNDTDELFLLFAAIREDQPSLKEGVTKTTINIYKASADGSAPARSDVVRLDDFFDMEWDTPFEIKKNNYNISGTSCLFYNQVTGEYENRSSGILIDKATRTMQIVMSSDASIWNWNSSKYGVNLRIDAKLGNSYDYRSSEYLEVYYNIIQQPDFSGTVALSPDPVIVGSTAGVALQKVTKEQQEAMTFQWQRSSDGTNWEDISGAEAMEYQTGDEDTEKQLRVRWTLYGLSKDTEPVVCKEPPIARPTPAAVIDYRNEKLCGLTAGEIYKINGMPYTADESGCISLEEGWLGTTLQIIFPKNSEDTLDSEPQSLAVPARPAGPGALIPVKTSDISVRDGKIMGVTGVMEYCGDSEDCTGSTDGMWTACTGSEISGLAHGIYWVRFAAGENHFAGQPVTVEVGYEVYCAALEGDGTFGVVCVNCTEMQSKAVTIINTGDTQLTGLTVSLEGTNADSFVLDQESVKKILGAEQKVSFTVKPAAGLLQGNYTATVVVSADHGVSEKLDLAVTVSNHSFTKYVSNNNATCTEDGTETAACDHCNATDTRPSVGSAPNHKIVKVEAKDPTAAEDGNTAYWYCSVCGKYFRDEALTQEIRQEDTVIKAPGETEKNGETENPGETEKTSETRNPGETEKIGETENPDETEKQDETEKTGEAETSRTAEGSTAARTGDGTNTWGWIWTLLGAGMVLAGSIVYRRKRKTEF